MERVVFYFLVLMSICVQGETDITQYHIRTVIHLRQAVTTVRCRQMNRERHTDRAYFHANIPQDAIVSGFKLEIDERLYPAVFEPRAVAESKYKVLDLGAPSSRDSPKRPRRTNLFEMGVDIEPSSNVTFNLVFKQFMFRRNEKYSHVTYVDPGQVVKDMQISIEVHESRDIRHLSVSPIARCVTYGHISENSRDVTIQRPTASSAFIHYHPSEDDQQVYYRTGHEGVMQLQYDLKHTYDSGDFIAENGFFLHFFAPSNLSPFPKDILFILDTSQSMMAKMEPLRKSMAAILDGLSEVERFNIIIYSTGARFWNPGIIMEATTYNVEDANIFMDSINDTGFTNTNEALMFGLEFMNSVKDDKDRWKTIIFLTDGKPSAGLEDSEEILKNVRTRNSKGIVIHSMGFGFASDMNFVEKLAAQNNGTSRRIYNYYDAHHQIKSFFDEIALPVYRNVAFTYGQLATVTSEHDFNAFYKRSEITVTGLLNKTKEWAGLSVSAEGQTTLGSLELSLVIAIKNGSTFTETWKGSKNIEQIQALLRVYQLTEALKRALTVQESLRTREQLLSLSGKYKLASDCMSIIVTTPKERGIVLIQQEDHKEFRDPTPPSPRREITPLSDSTHTVDEYNKLLRPTQGTYSDSGGAGGDPHFMVQVKGLDHPFCFDLIAKEGEIYKLLHDKDLELKLNGEIIQGMYRKRNGDLKTYFGQIFFQYGKFHLFVTPEHIRINKNVYLWNSVYSHFRIYDVNVTMSTKQSGMETLHVRTGAGASVHIKRMKSLSETDVDYLNVKVTGEHHLPQNTKGVLGQFIGKQIHLKQQKWDKKGRHIGTFVTFRNGHRFLMKGILTNQRNVLSGVYEQCWNVHKNGQAILFANERIRHITD